MNPDDDSPVSTVGLQEHPRRGGGGGGGGGRTQSQQNHCHIEIILLNPFNIKAGRPSKKGSDQPIVTLHTLSS